MKKTYPTSTKAKQWAKHLRPFGKRMANKSTRKINKADETETARPMAKQDSKQKFAVEFNRGNGKWHIWKKYVYEKSRDKAIESLIKKFRSSSFLSMCEYQFRKKDLK